MVVLAGVVDVEVEALDDCVVDVDLEVLDDVFVVVVCFVDDGVVVDANVVDSGWPLTILLTVAATLMPKAILPPVLARKSILPFNTCEPRDLSP